ncbi:DNA repair protein RAD51 homolog 4-like isoform X2 [Acropora millepora]|uniref:DNA repair protein RAD51 homolog 4-like isoform X2 n=1 Tax=Acropora millepora TaxID=45264 RepID=UPI001CF4C959|nr:DNA repair protein RAD51 homolog 4-like isoform X2 [Acropora millepora]
MNRLVSLSCGSLKSDQLDVLRSNGIKTVADFISCDVVSLAQKTSIPAKDLSSIQSIVIAQLAAFPLNGKDYYNGLMTRFSIFSTGCKNLDELLDGGLYTGDVTEIVGAAGTGKSQICMNIALSTSMEAKKYVIYIDTGGSFCGERIKQLLEGCKASLDDEEIHKILSRISVIQAFDIFSMLEALESVRQRLVSETEDEKTLQLRLVIVDCLAAVVSPVLGGQQIHGHSLMVNLSRILKSLAVEHALAVVITNNVVADSSWSSPFSTKPALGPTWGHVPNTRVFIQKQTEGSETNRIATITKSSRQKQIELIFSINRSITLLMD